MPEQNARFSLRKGTSILWGSVAPILLEGEPGWETDTKRLRIGDGVTPFPALPFLFSSESHPDLAGFTAGAYVANLLAAYTGNLNALNTTTIIRLGTGFSNGWSGAAVGDFVIHLELDAANAVQIGYDRSEGGRPRTRAKVVNVWSDWDVSITVAGEQVITGDKTFSGTTSLETLILTTLGRITSNTTLAGGFVANNDNDGTPVAGSTYTPTPLGGNFKSINNNGAFTFAAPVQAGCYTLVVEVTNGASAGTITFSGFARVSGDVITNVSGQKFQIFIAKTLSGVTASIMAMQ